MIIVFSTLVFILILYFYIHKKYWYIRYTYIDYNNISDDCYITYFDKLSPGIHKHKVTANRMLTQAAMDYIKSANYHWRKSGIELKVHL